MGERQATLTGLDTDRRNPALSQWYTPPALALKVARWADPTPPGAWVLEPSAGRGALIKAMDACSPTFMSAWDIDPQNCAALQQFSLEQTSLMVHAGDFTAHSYPSGTFRLALMNPPYEGNQDVAHIDRALDCSDRVVGIFQSRILHSKGRASFWARTDITRMAVLCERPNFGGDQSAKTDFVVMELVRRQRVRRRGEATATLTEWWSGV